jgi:hypothetical protein
MEYDGQYEQYTNMQKRPPDNLTFNRYNTLNTKVIEWIFEAKANHHMITLIRDMNACPERSYNNNQHDHWTKNRDRLWENTL